MHKLNFTKMVGAGNDFIILDSGVKSFSKLARQLCDRKTGIGADGALILEKSKIADFKMRIFNADGSEAEMCGNGLRCAVLFIGKNKTSVETKAGIYDGEITAENRVKIRMENPKDLRRDFSIKVNLRDLKVNYINTGVPHVVIFVEGLGKIDVNAIGRAVRYHKEFEPKGANVNFVEIVDEGNIKVRTYERGVEGETLACGTGSVAAAIISRVKGEGLRVKVNVHTQGGVLRVEFNKIGNKFKDVYLEGEAKIVFEGGIYV
ncbi:MAG: diaminopimelate epimerase [Candidatus Omnitrophota bacterium]|nr:diaminopimelate epimerase [Candidatus Omnitrophota bacterium]